MAIMDSGLRLTARPGMTVDRVRKAGKKNGF
jgi:hypothetical protein